MAEDLTRAQAEAEARRKTAAEGVLHLAHRHGLGWSVVATNVPAPASATQEGRGEVREAPQDPRPSALRAVPPYGGLGA